ncbi:hypothetical protein [Paenibacillus xylanexedens]|uniref:Heparin-sulfate lyase N-terminal domain-containing protein n=1 Tax=Paenibacillus xylanexedens TaxID=528191 RepID=A0ABS4RNS0_PAEXY|nr:hypothetical protein [Paenibacillus xylanexedens]MBP2244540.1 hypothetical protein [Paenibacillus xylanexedens]
MTQRMVEKMSKEQQYLVNQSMLMMDSFYDKEMDLLRSFEEEDSSQHSTRASAHYALGLLIRNESGDVERAIRVFHKVLDVQYDAPDEIYHGTFATRPNELHPPAGHYAWKSFAPGTAYFLERTFEKVSAQFIHKLQEEGSLLTEVADPKQLKHLFYSAVNQILPPVWISYDPNWREFIACVCVVVTAEFAELMPETLMKRMDHAMELAVQGSIERRLSDVIPMNTNIELMHIFITHYYGHRLNRTEWIQHSDEQAEGLMKEFEQYDGTFAEFNTTTYYGVDLSVLGMYRKYGLTERLVEIGHRIEHGLWNNIALYYNANLENLSGPFSRAYDMEMREHSSIGVFIYLLLGEGYEYLTGINCESGHDPLIALLGVDVPAEAVPYFKAHQKDRLVQKQFMELCERNDPTSNRNLCTAKAWVGEERMIGAMSGSVNTNGQMHPATIHWQTETGERYYLRLIRREVGEGWNSHLRGVTFDADLTPDSLTIDVELDTAEEIDVYFEIRGPSLRQEDITPALWQFPGLTCTVKAEAPEPSVLMYVNHVEIIYRYVPGTTANKMRFELTLHEDNGMRNK